jgi:hypothetical protein
MGGHRKNDCIRVEGHASIAKDLIPAAARVSSPARAAGRQLDTSNTPAEMNASLVQMFRQLAWELL